MKLVTLHIPEQYVEGLNFGVSYSFLCIGFRSFQHARLIEKTIV